MSELKTRPTDASVAQFLAQQPEARRADCEAVAFQAADQAMVRAIYAAGLAAGGKDNIEAVYHGEAKRTAPSVKITF